MPFEVPNLNQEHRSLAAAHRPALLGAKGLGGAKAQRDVPFVEAGLGDFDGLPCQVGRGAEVFSGGPNAPERRFCRVLPVDGEIFFARRRGRGGLGFVLGFALEGMPCCEIPGALPEQREGRAVEAFGEAPGVVAGVDGNAPLIDDGAGVVGALEAVQGDAGVRVAAPEGPVVGIGTPPSGQQGGVGSKGTPGREAQDFAGDPLGPKETEDRIRTDRTEQLQHRVVALHAFVELRHAQEERSPERSSEPSTPGEIQGADNRRDWGQAIFCEGQGASREAEVEDAKHEYPRGEEAEVAGLAQRLGSVLPGRWRTESRAGVKETPRSEPPCYTLRVVPEQSQKTIRVVAAVVERDGRYLITQRRETAVLPNLWEFPGGRVEQPESDAEALKREMQERLGTEVAVGELISYVTHPYEKYTVDLYLYECRFAVAEAELECRAVQDYRWVTSDEFDRFDFTPADEASMNELLGEGE